jgi:hypothetical protein
MPPHNTATYVYRGALRAAMVREAGPRKRRICGTLEMRRTDELRVEHERQRATGQRAGQQHRDVRVSGGGDDPVARECTDLGDGNEDAVNRTLVGGPGPHDLPLCALTRSRGRAKIEERRPAGLSL